MKIFLGGTCNDSKWRDRFTSMLLPLVEYFDPIVKDWTPECQDEERRQRDVCDYCLYVITPKMSGVYSIAEVVDDSNKRPDKTVFCIQAYDDSSAFSDSQWQSLMQVSEMVKQNGAKTFIFLDEVARFFNGKVDS